MLRPLGAGLLVAGGLKVDIALRREALAGKLVGGLQQMPGRIGRKLAAVARRKLGTLGFSRVELKVGNGEFGWPEHAPFDRILVCAASELVPHVLLHQLKPRGRMVVPTGMAEAQVLTVVEKSATGKISVTEVMPVPFALLETGC